MNTESLTYGICNSAKIIFLRLLFADVIFAKGMQHTMFYFIIFMQLKISYFILLYCHYHINTFCVYFFCGRQNLVPGMNSSIIINWDSHGTAGLALSPPPQCGYLEVPTGTFYYVVLSHHPVLGSRLVQAPKKFVLIT